MVKRVGLAQAIQRLGAVKKGTFQSQGEGEPCLNERGGTADPIPAQAAQAVLPEVRSPRGEERVSAVDSVQNGQCSNRTVSNVDSASMAQGSGGVGVSILDSVQNGHCPRQTVFILDSEKGEYPAEEEQPAARLAGNFTQIPNAVLRLNGHFSDPFDMVVYLHLYTYSYGFGRKTASMGQAQLERFTGGSKNRVKRALSRLEKDGWIKKVGDYEAGRVCRNWKVISFEDRGPDKWSKRGSKKDSVQNGQCPEKTESLSKMDTETLSKLDTYKERDKQNLKKTLSPIPADSGKRPLDPERELLDDLQKYFRELKPEGKRRSEWKFFLELRSGFEEQDIAGALEHLLSRGLPGAGEPCHSPMAFLSKGMPQVLRILRQEEEAARAREDRMRELGQVEASRLALEAEERQALQIRTEAFERAHPTSEHQVQWIRRVQSRFPMFSGDSPGLRHLAIEAWWSEKGGVAEMGVA